MTIDIKGNYEVRVAVIDCDGFGEDSARRCDVERAFEWAEDNGSIYSLGGFVEAINSQEVDDLSNSFIRVALVNLDDPEEIVEVDEGWSLLLNDGKLAWM